mgnify:CR=1 FL=1
MTIKEYSTYDGVGLGELVRTKQVSAIELLETAIEKTEALNPKLNAIVTRFDEQARDAAKAPIDGPFSGVPFLLKDILGDYAGVETRSGSRYLSGQPAMVDSTLTARFKASGVIPFGKTNVPEFGLLPTTESLLYGPARNPWNTDHITGGSSGGSAAAVAAGIVPMAHANDGGGSIRIPASCCGLVGLKPTRARNPLGPNLGDVMSGIIQEHIVSRTVRDTAQMLDCTQGPEIGAPYAVADPIGLYIDELTKPIGKLRVAFTKTDIAGNPLDPECMAGVEKTAKLLESLGHHVEEVMPELNQDILTQSFMAVWASGLAMQVEAVTMFTGRAPGPDDIEPLSRALLEVGQNTSAGQYLLAVAMLQDMARTIAQFQQTYDVWLTPTLGKPALPIGTIDVTNPNLEESMAPVMDFSPFTAIMNATGQPAITLPLHQSGSGLPIGMMFAGRFGEEDLLLQLAAQLEQAAPWKDRKPTIWA